MTWSNVKIKQYQDIFPVLSKDLKSDIDALDQSIDILIYFEGKNREYYEELSAAQLYKLSAKYNFLTTLPNKGALPSVIRLGGIKFIFDYNPANVKYRLTAKDLIDITTLSQKPELMIMNYHRVIAAYIKPKKVLGLFKRKISQDEIEMRCLEMDMETASKITGFFLPLLTNCLTAIQSSLLNEVKAMDKMITKVLTNTGDGRQH